DPWSMPTGRARWETTRSRVQDPLLTPIRERRRRMQRIGAGLTVLAVIASVFALTRLGGSDDKGPLPVVPPTRKPAPGAPTINSLRADDPFKYSPERDADFLTRGREGLAHVLYEKSPGGIVASAERTARWRSYIDAAAKRHDVDPNTIEAI